MRGRCQRLKRRHQAEGTWTDELATAIASKYIQPLHLPHVSLNSVSTGQAFILFVRRHVMQESELGSFNAYGLSLGEATVPVF